MNTTTNQYRRHTHYLDHTLQKWLLLTLIAMEAILVSLAIWALYKALGTIIDEEMYRIHYSASTQLLPLLIKEGAVLLGWMLLANVLALLAADRIWAFFVHGILKKLALLMLASQNLDFTNHDGIRSNHTVLEQALTWRSTEAQLLQKRRGIISSLPHTLPASAEARAELAAGLEQLQLSRQ